MKVKIYFKKNSPYGKQIEFLDDVIEIHYNYKSVMKEPRIAFEMKGTGITYQISHIEEFIALK